MMKLTIVIPALNEEEAIGSIIQRCLDARARITRESPVGEVEIIVVSDGSTDRTADIAHEFASNHRCVRVIVFERNRGYGAAIKRGFAESTGDLVGFLDADGTCDPEFFGTLCRELTAQNASIALGSRMGPQSRMPKLRRLGNRGYAVILSMLSNHVVSDTASGMRVIRRDVLRKLYPLPDGLHFTPAMSARVLMDANLKLVECPMSYEERIGESKLHVFRDGWRFLRTIFEMSMMWQPSRFLTAAALVCFAVMTALAMHPIEMWINLRHLQEDMIYRLLFCSFLGMVGMSLMSTGVVARNLRGLTNNEPHRESFVDWLLNRLFSLHGVVVVSAPTVVSLALLVGRGWWTWASRGFVDEHWSRIVLAGLIGFAFFQLLVTVLLVNLIRFHTARRAVDPQADVSTTMSRSTADLLFEPSLKSSPTHENEQSADQFN